MFKRIFQRMFCIITQPTKTWCLLDDDDITNEKFLSHYLYPIFGMITLSAFAGSIIADQSLEQALKLSIEEFVTYFAGFYLAVFLMKELMSRKFGSAGQTRNHCFVAYASSLIYAVSIIISLLGFHLLYLFLPYTIYIIWEGAVSYMKIREEDQVKFTIASTLIVFVPYLIGFIINKFMFIAPHAANQ